MKKKEVLKAVVEFNKVVVLETPVNEKETDFAKLCKSLYVELHHIEKGDVFTPKTLKTFADLKEAAEESKQESKKSKSVEVGTTVELDVDTNEIKKVEVMSKKVKGAKVENVEVITAILNPKVSKDELVKLIKSEKVFAKSKKALLAVTNFMSLKKQMREVFDADVVAEIKATLPKVKREPKAKVAKVDPLVEAITNAEKSELKSISKQNEKFEDFDWKEYKKDVEDWRANMLAHIAPKTEVKKEKPAPKVDPETEKQINSVKSATKVKQLKVIAKADERFNWKELKKLDFEAMQTNMLNAISGTIVKAKKEPAKPKMIVNPLIPEIEAFTKVKKLKKWAADKPEFADVKIKKGMDLEEAQANLFSEIPAEIEQKKTRVTGIKNWDERKAYYTEMIATGKYPRPELMKMFVEKFPGQDKVHSNILSECKNEKYNRLDKLVETNKKGNYRFVK